MERGIFGVLGFQREIKGLAEVLREIAIAIDALERIRERCDRLDDGSEETAIQVWEAVDWFAGSGLPLARGLGITATTTDAELEAIEKTEVDGARAEGIDILVGLHDYLEKLRKLVIDDGE